MVSPFSINFNNFGTPFYDPGLLIYEPSSDELSYSVEVIPTYKNNNNEAAEFAELENQISTITLNVTVSQNGTSLRREVKPFRTYSFLDDFNPLISVSPETNENDRFIMVEAGFPYDDENQSGDGGDLFDIWNDNNVIVQNDVELKVTAYDVTDGDLTSSIVRTVTDLNDNPVSLRTGSGYVNNIYKIRYDVSDFAENPAPNAADPKYRFLVVKDSIGTL